MRLVGAAFVAGMLGVLIGSLAAQAPRDDPFESRGDDLIYEGPVEVVLKVSDDPIEAVLTGDGRVYEGWVMLTETRRLIPRDQIQMVAFDVVGERAVEERENFGNAPGETAPRRKPFRED